MWKPVQNLQFAIAFINNNDFENPASLNSLNSYAFSITSIHWNRLVVSSRHSEVCYIFELTKLSRQYFLESIEMPKHITEK